MERYMLAAIEAGIVKTDEIDMYSDDEFMFFDGARTMYAIGLAWARSWMGPDQLAEESKSRKQIEQYAEDLYTDMEYDSAITSYGFILHF